MTMIEKVILTLYVTVLILLFRFSTKDAEGVVTELISDMCVNMPDKYRYERSHFCMDLHQIYYTYLDRPGKEADRCMQRQPSSFGDNGQQL